MNLVKISTFGPSFHVQNISDGTNNNRILWALRSSAARAPYLQRYGGAVAEVVEQVPQQQEEQGEQRQQEAAEP